MASLKDVAKEVGLSVSVVSRVLNPAPDANARISSSTRQRVLEAAARLGYRPNVYASTLRKQENRLILCIVGDVCRHPDMEHLKRLEYELGKRNYNLLVQFLLDLPEKVKLEFIERIINMPAGIAVWSLGIRDEENLAGFRRLFDNAPPTLSLSIPFPGSKIDYIRINWGAASYKKAVNYFASKGFRRVCCCCSGPAAPFAEAARELNMEFSILNIPEVGQNHLEAGRRMAERLLKMPELPQGIYCTSDEMAFPIIEEFRAAGINVPGDVFILGGGDSAFARYFHDRFPVLHHESSLLCKTAADYLISRIERGERTTGSGECVAQIDCAIHEISEAEPEL